LLGNLLIYSGRHSMLLCELSLFNFVPLEPRIVSAWDVAGLVGNLLIATDLLTSKVCRI
jgi:hypothetical protein